MKSIVILGAIFMASFVVANPIAAPVPDAVADPFRFYKASGTALPLKKREVKVKRDTVIPAALLTRNPLEKRTQSPTTGTHANKCSNEQAVGGISYTCGTGNAGPCCSRVGFCGENAYYCGGGCQDDFGSCKLPYVQLTFDADDGDAMWDVATDNVFDALPGDGIIYYGATPTVVWPS